ncbi:acetyl-CoA carboxylase 1 [Aphelenchoides avenae]|nr:acetyl-CoA carboxylase 1 [Aphelenchus avenae]
MGLVLCSYGPRASYTSNFQTSLETIRVMYFNETGAIPDLSAYRVVNARLQPLNEEHKRFKGKDCYEPHWSITQTTHVQVQKKRYQAHKLNTTYVYDFPIVFGRAALDLWKQYQQTDPKSFAKAIEKLSPKRREALVENNPKRFAVACEMILDDSANRFYVCRDKDELRRRAENGANDRGMLAWEIDICTPDAIEGRRIVVIANDITYALGSFSMREHNMYQQASEYSRKHKMPRVYLAANSGARIGFASEIKQRLNVAWNDDARPEDGFRYLCVDCEGPSDPVLGQVLSSEDENGRRRLDAVIGKEDDIGVENLVGSGLIAGETSAAYREVPTYCLVTGRAVGIGAYAARLAHRICQVETSDIILTGAPALNSLLGREIYTSNSQLGGPQIMFNNGVSHSVVQTDLEGVRTVLKWISYVPHEGELVPRPMLKDDQARPVETQPTKAAYDPRTVLDPPEGGGLFDRGTFDEVMSGWAKTIIAGRARLRGLPVGVVAVETRTVESEIPADPAAQDSQSRLVQQAGQVWYPDSAYKTAEAINDFNREGLPLIFIANIRGFSGGQKGTLIIKRTFSSRPLSDMFEMVLKFGACIVDALQSYTQPVIVYIPPYGELRGGAWAVLDTKINSTCITMLADPDSRGGVLEPEGIVEIKFRKGDLHALMSKCDAKLQRLEASLKAETLSKDERKTIQLAADKRREFLMPVYRTAAVKFADLHDTTARMIAKGAIHDEVSWRDSRNYFYDLFSVQLAKFSMARQYLQASGVDLAHLRIDELTRGCQWVEEHLARLAQKITYQRTVSTDLAASRRRYEYVAEKIDEYAQGAEFRRVTDGIEQERVTDAFSEVLKKLDATQQRSLLAKLTAQLSTPSAERH